MWRNDAWTLKMAKDRKKTINYFILRFDTNKKLWAQVKFILLKDSIYLFNTLMINDFNYEYSNLKLYLFKLK